LPEQQVGVAKSHLDARQSGGYLKEFKDKFVRGIQSCRASILLYQTLVKQATKWDRLSIRGFCKYAGSGHKVRNWAAAGGLSSGPRTGHQEETAAL
jgi:hypothetical protein